MKDYNNKLNGNLFKSNDEDFLKFFNENRCQLFNEKDDNEEDNLIYKTKDIYINNNLSRLVTCENSPNNLYEIENVEIKNTNNNNLSTSQKTTDSNNYVLTQAELFVIPSINFNNNLNKEKKILGRKKKILLFKAKKINFQKII